MPGMVAGNSRRGGSRTAHCNGLGLIIFNGYEIPVVSALVFSGDVSKIVFPRLPGLVKTGDS